ncbi:DUF1766-domain-containing protein, partial [Delitschia confertaspora ATCC 74209]
MPYIPHTPESLIPRSDSRNPATTCKGITAAGKPCRRSIGASKASRNTGILAVVSVTGSDSEDSDTGAAAYFCWQHKDQAKRLAAANTAAPSGRDTKLYPLQERTSIDTLVQRLGVLDVEDAVESAQTQAPKRKRRERHSGSRGSGGREPGNRASSGSNPRRVSRPPTWDRVQGPLLEVPSDVMASEKRRTSQRPANNQPQSQRKKPGFWSSLFCCMGAVDDNYVEVVRHKRRTEKPEVSESTQYVSEAPMPQYPPRTRPAAISNNLPQCNPLGEKLVKPLNRRSSQSETYNLLSLIPKSLPPQTASSLLSELSKPISTHDDEGYIYIFWLTSEAAGPAPSSTASSLLAPPSRPEQGRQTSDILRKYSVKSSSDSDVQRARPSKQNTRIQDETEKKTILLKIGRASNVHRRMNEWTRQCGYELSLVRFYPYVSTSSPAPSPQTSPGVRRPSTSDQKNTVRKVPHAHRVERLIHLELSEQRVKKNCEACGKEHREWFEVEATREGVKKVDEVIRRWVGWAE